jgi:hypothetical protein
LADDRVPVNAIGPDVERALDLAATASRIGTDTPPIILFDALLPLEPGWARGRQGIGDCVSWGFELAATLNTAVDIMVRRAPWKWRGPYATEPIYAGARVEASGVKRGGYSDGTYGGVAAKWLTQWGALLRLDYSLATGNPEHDLRKYDPNRAKAWGNFGCGGERDQDKLDAVARETPVKQAFLVPDFLRAAAAIESGYAVAVCSNQGFGARGADGFAPAKGSWSHCMAFTGVRYDNPGLLLSNSWGNSWGTSAPFYPADYPHAEVIKCSAWVDDRTCNRMLAQDDSYVLTDVQGLERREIDWAKGWEITGR